MFLLVVSVPLAAAPSSLRERQATAPPHSPRASAEYRVDRRGSDRDDLPVSPRWNVHVRQLRVRHERSAGRAGSWADDGSVWTLVPGRRAPHVAQSFARQSRGRAADRDTRDAIVLPSGERAGSSGATAGCSTAAGNGRRVPVGRARHHRSHASRGRASARPKPSDSAADALRQADQRKDEFLAMLGGGSALRSRR